MTHSLSPEGSFPIDSDPAPQSNSSSPNKTQASKTLRYVLHTLLGLCVVFVCYVAVQAIVLVTNLNAAQDEIEHVKTLVAEHQFDELPESLSNIKNKTEKAAQAANDPFLGLVGHLPFIGDDYRAVKTVTNSAFHILTPAEDAAQLLPLLTGNNLAQSISGIDVGLLSKVSVSMTKLQNAVHQSRTQLGAIDTTKVIGKVSSPVNTLNEMLGKASPTLDAFVPYVSALPAILGQETKTTWFLTMQNLGEARSSGGLLGAWLIISAENGKLEILRQGSNDDLIAGGPVEYEQIMPAGYQDMWGDYLGEWLSLNLSAHFPDNAALIRAGWNARGEEQVDGVIAMGQGLLPYVAAAVGDVESNGKRIAPTDLDDYLTVGVYHDFPDVSEKDAAVDDIIGQVFGKVTSGAFDVNALFKTFSDQSTGDYLQMWSTNPKVQKQIIESQMGGILPSDFGPSASVRVINGGENKLDIFLNLKASYDLEACVFDEDANNSYRPGQISVDITNNSPTSGLPPYISGRGDDAYEGEEAPAGSNHDIVAIYTPVEAETYELLLDGEEAYADEAIVDGRYAYLFDVELLAGQTKNLTVKWHEPVADEFENKLSHEPQIFMQPLFREPVIETTSSGACS